MRDIKEREGFEEELLENDPLQNLTSTQEARRWVDRVVVECRPLEVLQMVELFLKSSLRVRMPKAKSKGGGIDDNCDDGHDESIYRFLALADSVHDSHSMKYFQSPEKIMAYMGMKSSNLPKGLSPEKLKKEEDVINFLQNRKFLRFGREDVLNPCRGADLAHFDVQKPRVVDKKPEVDILRATYRQAAEAVKRSSASSSRRVLCVPVYSQLEIQDASSSRLKRLQLAQMLDLASHMRNWFGTNCVLQPDTYHPILKFLMSIRFIDKAFYDKFVIDRDFHVLKYEHEIRQAISRSGESAKTEWKMALSDANYFDGTSIPDSLDVDPTPTGFVFRHGIAGISPYNIRLEGITTQDKVRFSEFVNDKSTEFELTRAEAQTTYATSSLFSRLPGIPRNKETLTNAKCCELLNLKRACDWGQVEACKRRGWVFLTADRLAALYAYYRVVRFVLVRIHDYQELGQDMIQYSCCLGR